MDPVTLHFNVFQAGAPVRTSLQVEDPRGTTILALKQQLFGDEIKACKSVRFISAGKILDDATAVERYKLGKEAHIHVSISENGSGNRPSVPSGVSGSVTASEQAKTIDGSSSANHSGMSAVGWAILAGAAIFIGTGGLLFAALRQRYKYTMHTSQLLFICAAIWVYLLFFHGFPALFQALSKLGSSSASKDGSGSPTSMAVSSVPAAGPGNEATSTAASSSTASPATAAPSPGLSLMTPTLPPGDATAASVLTQRCPPQPPIAA